MTSVSKAGLRDRWVGQEDRMAAIVADLKSTGPSGDWTRHLLKQPDGRLDPLPFIDECARPCYPGDAARRDLRGITLRNIDLCRTTALADTTLDYAILENVQLREASLTGSSFVGAHFTGTTSMYGVTACLASFKNASCRAVSLKDSNLTGANLIGCDVRDADLRGALLRRAQVSVEGTFGRFVGGRPTRFGGAYQTMRNLHSGTEHWLRKYIATSSEIADLHRQHPILAAIWYWLANYGRSAGRLACWTGATWLLFALLYFSPPLPRWLQGTSIGGALEKAAPRFVVGGHPKRLSGPGAAYLSTITMTTLGYGDIVPAADDAFCQFLVAAQAVSGVIFIGAFVSVLIQNATITTE
jgi:Ion channel/Pentapeptide repeats (8 copies)